MAQAKTEEKDAKTQGIDLKSLKRSDIYDAKSEEIILNKFIKLGLQKTDETWTKHKTKIKGLEIGSKYVDKGSIGTIRGTMIIKDCKNIDELYQLYEPGNNDVWNWEKSNDKMCTEAREVMAIDSTHSCVYGSYASEFPSMIIAPRDFCYMNRRGILYNYKIGDTIYDKISYAMAYSIDETHQFYVDTKKKHVRGILKYSGIIFIKQDNGTVKGIYLVHLDPRGYIPTFVVNLVAADQAMVITQINKNWVNAVNAINGRKDGNYKRDREYLFNDEPPLSQYEIKPNNGNNNNDDGNERKEADIEVIKGKDIDPNIIAYQKAVYNNDMNEDE